MISNEKLPDCPFDYVVVHDIRIESRYCKRREFELMAEVINDIPGAYRCAIASLHCDSKAGDVFKVELLDNHEMTKQIIAHELDTFISARNGGHNGIYCGEVFVDSHWEGDDREMVG